jgi:multiple sugar transport system substrate-binding protein
MSTRLVCGAVSRRAVAGGAAGGALAALAACGTAASTPDAGSQLALSKEPITITPFLTGVGDALLNRWNEEIVAPYRARRPNVTVEFIPQTGPSIDRIEKLRAMFAAGAPPDLSEGPQRASTMVDGGLLEPALDALIKRDRYDLKRYNQSQFKETVVYEGKVWQLPYRYGGNVICLACNTTLFAQAGVEPPPQDASKPWTWEQFATAAQRLTKTDGAGQVRQFGLNGIGWMIGTWPPVWQTDWLGPDRRTVTCDSAPMRDCYTKLADLFQRYHVLPRPGEASRLFGAANLFNTGKAAILLFPPTNWRAYGEGAQVDYTVAPLPKVKVSRPDMGMGGIGIIKGSKHPADAWDLLKYLIEDSRYAILTGRMPAVLPDIEPWVRDQFRNVPSADSKTVLKIVEWAGTPGTRVGSHPKYTEILDVLNPLMADLQAGEIAPLAMLQTAKPLLQSILGSA